MDETRWKVYRHGTLWGELETQLAGEYNVMNAAAAVAMAAARGVEVETIANALRTFRSVKRRLEIKAELHGITIIDDFAHHPTAIAGTLKALRTRYAGRRLWAVLEPRSNTLRRKVFEPELADSLSLADRVVLAGVFKSDAIPAADRLDPAGVVHRLEGSGVNARLIATVDDIVATIASELREGDVVAILSNGGFGNIYEKLPAKLNAMREASTPA
jgi:UDP-N-acetylmuramate: L-alanyl-gamma-D-glutamyl-meso-diaminopimelate ligase